MREDLARIHRGVTARWLAEAFGMSTYTVKKRLADCPCKTSDKGYTTYRLRDAAACLVAPTTTRPLNDSNPARDKDYWDARLKQQRWEENAGDLWRTADVERVLGETFATIRTAMQMCAEQLDRRGQLTPALRREVIAYCDGLLDAVRNALVTRDHATLPTLCTPEPDQASRFDGQGLARPADTGP